MAGFRRYSGKTVVRWFPKTASTAIAKGDLVTFASGYITPATSSTTKHVGVCRKAIASTDSDYASTTKIPIEVPAEPMVEWRCDSVSGTLVAAELGTYVDLTDANTVNADASTVDALLVTKIFSTTSGAFVLADNAAYNN